MDGPGDEDGDGDFGMLDNVWAILQPQFETVVVSQANIDEEAPATLGYMFSLPLGNLEVVGGGLKKCQDAKDVAHGPGLLAKKE